MRRREKDIKLAGLKYLKTLENQGEIIWVDRLNSGKYFIPGSMGYRGRLIQGCRAGTPDSFVILKSGRIVWIEYKGNGKLTDEQKKFRSMVTGIGHAHLVIRDIDSLIEAMEKILL